MRVLVACEFSNRVRDAFLRRGHDAYSCDLQRADHPNPNWRRHIRGGVRPLLRERWDLVIAHPPCTYLCNSGVRWIHERDGRLELVKEGAAFFLECLNTNAPRVCVENPTMHKYAWQYIKQEPTQAIHPWQFGEPESKRTCLWLRGLPSLIPTRIVGGRLNRNGQIVRVGSNNRSRTYQGVANAMVAQWG